MDEATPPAKHARFSGSTEYQTTHQWLRRHYPKTGICDECGKTARTEFALIKGRSYTRNREDYRELCKLCHNRYDLTGIERSPEVRARMAVGKQRWWDEIKQNGIPLSWVSRGEGCYQAKLTEELVRECRRRVAAGEQIKAVARDVGVHRLTLGDAVRGRTWAHIEGAVPAMRPGSEP